MRLFDEVQARTRDLTEALQQQTATADVLKVISRSAFDLQTVLDTLRRLGRATVRRAAGDIYLRDGDAFRCRSRVGISANLFERFARQSDHAGRATVAARRAGGDDRTWSTIARRIPMSIRYGRRAKTGGYRAMLGVPLLRDGELDRRFYR